MNDNKIVVAKIICKIRKADEPRWKEELVFTNKKMLKSEIKVLLNKHGRISKGSYQYSIKVLQYDEDSKTKKKPAYSIVSNWNGKLGEVEQFIKEHTKNWNFYNEIMDKIEEAMKERCEKEIKKE